MTSITALTWHRPFTEAFLRSLGSESHLTRNPSFPYLLLCEFPAHLNGHFSNRSSCLQEATEHFLYSMPSATQRLECWNWCFLRLDMNDLSAFSLASQATRTYAYTASGLLIWLSGWRIHLRCSSQKMLVQSLGQAKILWEGMATHLVFCWEANPEGMRTVGYSPWGFTRIGICCYHITTYWYACQGFPHVSYTEISPTSSYSSRVRVDKQPCHI